MGLEDRFPINPGIFEKGLNSEFLQGYKFQSYVSLCGGMGYHQIL